MFNLNDRVSLIATGAIGTVESIDPGNVYAITVRWSITSTNTYTAGGKEYTGGTVKIRLLDVNYKIRETPTYISYVTSDIVRIIRWDEITSYSKVTCNGSSVPHPVCDRIHAKFNTPEETL